MIGCSGGSELQKQASNSNLAKNDANVDGNVSCPVSSLRVAVVRSDNEAQGLSNVTVRLKGGASPVEKTSAANTGLAEFSDLSPGNLVVELVLRETDAKKFKAPVSQQLVLTQGSRKELTFRLEPLVQLQLILLDKKDKPISGAAWKLLSPQEEKGTTGPDGLIKIESLPSGTNTGKLQVILPKPTQSVVAQAPPVANDTYPPQLKPDAFKDEAPKPLDLEVNWTLTILNPDKADLDSDDALRGRLHNLGFAIDVGGGSEQTKLAVKAYQLHYKQQSDGSGSLASIKDDLKKRHDSPPA